MKPQIVRHGEVILKPISKLPKGAKILEETKKHIVAHSETGHHHVLESLDQYQVYALDGEKYVVLGNVADLFHEKTGKDVHTTHKITPAIYKVVIKKSFDYFKGVMERVRD